MESVQKKQRNFALLLVIQGAFLSLVARNFPEGVIIVPKC